MKFLPLELLMALMSKGATRKHESFVRRYMAILVLSLAVRVAKNPGVLPGALRRLGEQKIDGKRRRTHAADGVDARRNGKPDKG